MKTATTSHFGHALWTLMRVLGLTAVAFWLSLSPSVEIWLLGQGLLAVSILQWFVLLHDFGHESFFKSKTANLIGGYVASVFCLVPFGPWKLMHAKHHAAGSLDEDPTMQSGQKRVLNKFEKFCWQVGIPLYSLKYSLKNFWAIKKLWKMFPDRGSRFQLVLSFCVMQLFFMVLRPMIPDFFRTWLLGYFVFLMLVDVLLTRQHSDLYQGQYGRTLRLPRWVSRYVFLNFNHHVEHYSENRVPCYSLNRVLSRS